MLYPGLSTSFYGEQRGRIPVTMTQTAAAHAPSPQPHSPARVGTEERPYRVAIVGAGPAGFFAAGALLSQDGLHVQIDLFDRQPAPYGLVRYGVAPDHHEITKVAKVYRTIGEDARVRYLGNVEFGKDVTRRDLLAYYDHVVYAVGAQQDRRLGVPGEELPGCHTAGAFVSWYTGHPDYAELPVDLSHPVAVIIGMGNVALDIARILAKTPAELATTDIADHTLRAVVSSRVRDIYIVARRGPAHAKCTLSELKEFGTLQRATPIVDPHDLVLDADSEALVASSRKVRRIVEQLGTYAEAGPTGEKRVHFMFQRSPLRLQGGDRIEGVQLHHHGLTASGAGSDPEVEVLGAGLVITSLGRRAVLLPDVAYDDARGLIPNIDGRVVDPRTGRVMAGEYVAGWAKRGSTGVIGTNKADAAETVQAMLSDLQRVVDDPSAPERSYPPRAAHLPTPSDRAQDRDVIGRLLAQRQVRFVDFTDWGRLDALEVANGKAQGRPRVKMTAIEAMLEHLDS